MATKGSAGRVTVRRSGERGYEDFGWTDNWMTFSFAGYEDPDWIRFGPIRVIVENHIQPRSGFPPHPHRDMEILTYVAAGTLTHADDMGHRRAIDAGEMQLISAGRGIVHSERNEHDAVEHNLQVWILPDAAGLDPAYQQIGFDVASRRGRLRLYASPEGREGSMRIRQAIDVHAGILSAGTTLTHPLESGRGTWIQLVRGSVDVAGIRLSSGDGLGVEAPTDLTLAVHEETELVLFDAAMDFRTPYRLD